MDLGSQRERSDGSASVFNVRGVDGDTTSLFFRSAVDLSKATTAEPKIRSKTQSHSSGQRGFTVVDVTDGANVDVREGTVNFSLARQLTPS